MNIPLPWPQSGVVLSLPKGAARSDSTDEGQNVRITDPTSGIECGAQRAGLSKLLALPVGNGPVLDLNQITTDVPRVVYSQNGYSDLHSVQTRWSTALDRGVFPVAMQAHLDGRIYVFDTKGNLSEYSRAGEFVRSFSVPGTNGYQPIDRLVVDEAGYIYVAASKAEDHAVSSKIFQIKRVTEENGFFKVRWTITTALVQAFDFDVRGAILGVVGQGNGLLDVADNRILKWIDIYNTDPTLGWNVQYSATATKPKRVRLGKQGANYICASPDSGTPPFRVGKWFTDGTKAWAVEAVLSGVGCGLVLTEDNDVITCGPKDGDNVVMRKILDLGTSFSTTEHTGASGTFTLTVLPLDGQTVTIGTRAYTYKTVIDNAVPDQVLIGVDITACALNFSNAILHTLGLSTYSDATTVNLQVTASSAVGVVTVLAKVKGVAGNAIATTTTVGGATWGAATLTGGADVANGGAWTGTDAVDVYRGVAGSLTTVLHMDSTGDVYAAVNTIGVGKQMEKRQGNSGHFLYGHSATDPAFFYGKTITADLPALEPVYRTLSVTGPLQVYLGTSAPTSVDNIHGLRVVSKDHDRGPDAVTRIHIYTAICNGSLVTFVRDGNPTTPTGGGSILEPTSIYNPSTVAFGKLYFTDGIEDWVYDPEGFEEIPRRDFVEEWKPEKGGGRMPENAKLLATCFGRVFRARFSDDGQNWACSERGNPLNWSFFPHNETDAQALIGNDSRVGPCPDIINALIPYSTDLLYFGCDHSIHAMVGDPGFRGQFVLVSSTVGVAFGSPYCLDPSGVLYFFGSRGGIWALAPGGIPQSITENSIDPELLSIDLARFRVRMEWDTKLQALHVMFIDRETPSAETKHWVWEKRRAFWWDVYGSQDLQPTSLFVFDGDDPGDRVVAIGCYDGRVRFIDPDALGDDGIRIEAKVSLYTPTNSALPGELLFKSLQPTLAYNQDGCSFEWLVGPSPDRMESVARGELAPGLNQAINERRRGGYVKLRLYQAAPNERFAFEACMVDAVPFGRRRARV